MSLPKLWTATVFVKGLRVLLSAQAKSSRAELVRRLRADDPVWWSGGVRFTRQKRFCKAAFKRGLAIKAVHVTD